MDNNIQQKREELTELILMDKIILHEDGNSADFNEQDTRDFVYGLSDKEVCEKLDEIYS